MTAQHASIWNVLLNYSTIVIFVVVFVIFGLSSSNFLTLESLINIVKQASFTGIVAIGMTFVLLTAGIDLSVGSNMYLSSVFAGILMRQAGFEVGPALAVALLLGALFGGVGNIFGAVVGALLIQMVQAGLVFNSVNLYLQPMVRAVIIFIAIFFDSLREANLKKLKRRFIRPLESTG